MKKAGWIIGIILTSLVCVFIILLITLGVSDTTSNGHGDDGQLSAIEAMALTWRCSELYCAGVYYTDKAISVDPKTTSYTEWKALVDKAEAYWVALDEAIEKLEDGIDEDTFDAMYRDKDASINPFCTTAYALDSAEIIRVFDSAPAGKRLKTLAKHLGKDMKYAQQALKMANGQLTSEAWNDFANTAQKLEAGARALKTGASAAAFVAGGPALTATMSGAATVVGGASLLMQVTDDGCFIMMGDKYDSSEFVANLQKASDYIAPVAGAAGLMSMDFSKGSDAVLASYEYAENLRALIQDGKVLGIQLGLKSGKMTAMTHEELKQYQQAKRDGKDIPKNIESLLDMLDGEQQEQKELQTFTLTASKNPVMAEERVTFTVEDTKPEYTYIYEYGNNKNPQESNSFEYMYQVAGTYTMNVTVLDEQGEEIGRGSCSIEVVDMPTPTPEVTPEATAEPSPEPMQQSAGGVAQFAGTWAPADMESEMAEAGLEMQIIIDKNGSVSSRIYSSEIGNIDTQLPDIEYRNGEYHMTYMLPRTITINDDGNLVMHVTKDALYNYWKSFYSGVYDDATVRGMVDTYYDEYKTSVWIPTLTIKGTFGGTSNGTTSKITFYGDGTGNYQLTGNMTTDQDFTYTIVPNNNEKYPYKVKLVFEEGWQPSFDVPDDGGIVNGEIVIISDMHKQ